MVRQETGTGCDGVFAVRIAKLNNLAIRIQYVPAGIRKFCALCLE